MASFASLLVYTMLLKTLVCFSGHFFKSSYSRCITTEKPSSNPIIICPYRIKLMRPPSLDYDTHPDAVVRGNLFKLTRINFPSIFTSPPRRHYRGLFSLHES